MITRVFIFGLLCNVICTCLSENVIIQALPSTDHFQHDVRKPSDSKLETTAKSQSNEVADRLKRDCGPKIMSYKEKIPLVTRMLDNYTAMTEKHKLDPADKVLLEAERDRVRTIIDDLTAKFNPDLEKLGNLAGGRARVEWCVKEMGIYLKKRRDLTLAGKKFKEDVLDILNHTARVLPLYEGGTAPALPPYPKNVRDDYDQVLSEIVNWLFIIDLGTNMMKSTATLLKKLYDMVRTNVKLDKLWMITEDGKVEAPEANDIAYHDEDVKDEGFDEEMVKDEFEILKDNTFYETDEPRESAKLIEEPKGAKIEEVPAAEEESITFVDEFGKIFKIIQDSHLGK